MLIELLSRQWNQLCHHHTNWLPWHGGLHIRKFLWPASLQGFWGFLTSLETFLPFKRATEEERAASCGPQNQVSAFSSSPKKNSGNNFDWNKCWRKAPQTKHLHQKKKKPPQHFQKELWTNMQEGNFLHFLMVSIGPPARRASFTAFSSFLAAAPGAFFLTTTGSQSCDTGPIPAMAPFSFFPSLQKRKKK